MKRTHQEHSKFLIALGGPTAVGKTRVSITLAQKFETEILSSDSRQLYKEMTIGTAKPNKQELSLVKHHFINHISIHQNYNAGKYEKEALGLLNEIFSRKPIAIITGGTGLYMNAVLRGMDFFPPVSQAIKTEVEQMYMNEGITALQKFLEKADPTYFMSVDRNNPQRLSRAIAVIKAGGKPYSFFLGKHKPERQFKVVRIMLNLPREELYNNINQRVEKMMADGLLEEARMLYPHRYLPALNTVGYKELFAYVAGEISLDEAISLIKRNSRRYAKRQLTWFKNQGAWMEFHPDHFQEMENFIRNMISQPDQ